MHARHSSRSLVLRLLPFALASLHGAGCGGATPRELSLDVAPVVGGSWVRLAPDTTWQWQLSGTIDTTYAVAVYDVDLFETPKETLDALQAAGRTVICYFSAGSSEDWRPDFGDFPADALGRKLSGWAGERWLDIRRRDVFALMEKRLDLAVAHGCDAVEPDNVDGSSNQNGFGLSLDDQLAFDRNLANAAHDRGLAVALKNGGGMVEELIAYFDFELNEQCHEYDECQDFAPFVSAGKAVLNAEYPGSQAKAVTAAPEICGKAKTHSTRTLLLPLDLDNSFRIACP